MQEQETQTIDELGSKIRIDENGNFKTKTEEEIQNEKDALQKQNEEKGEQPSEKGNEENLQSQEKVSKDTTDNNSEVSTKDNAEAQAKAEEGNTSENSSLTDIATNEEGEQKGQTEDFESMFNERLKKEGYVKREDLEKEFEEKSVTENELISELLNLDKKGVKVTKEKLKELLTDYSSYNPENVNQASELIKQDIMQSEGLDASDAMFELQDQYEALFDQDADPDSPEYQRAKRKFTIRAKKIIQQKQKEQSELKLPDPSLSQESVNKEEVIKSFLTDLEKQKTQQQEGVKNYLKHVADETTKKLDKVSFEIGGESYDYEPTSEVKEKVKDAVLNWQNFMDREFISNNKVDTDKLSKFLTRYYANEDVDKLIRGKSKAEGKEEQFKETKNAKPPQSNPKPTEKSSDPELEAGRQLLEREKKGKMFF